MSYLSCRFYKGPLRMSYAPCGYLIHKQIYLLWKKVFVVAFTRRDFPPFFTEASHINLDMPLSAIAVIILKSLHHLKRIFLLLVFRCSITKANITFFPTVNKINNNINWFWILLKRILRSVQRLFQGGEDFLLAFEYLIDCDYIDIDWECVLYKTWNT